MKIVMFLMIFICFIFELELFVMKCDVLEYVLLVVYGGNIFYYLLFIFVFCFDSKDILSLIIFVLIFDNIIGILLVCF